MNNLIILDKYKNSVNLSGDYVTKYFAGAS